MIINVGDLFVCNNTDQDHQTPLGFSQVVSKIFFKGESCLAINFNGGSYGGFSGYSGVRICNSMERVLFFWGGVTTFSTIRLSKNALYKYCANNCGRGNIF